jgi:hypothetical protein
MLSLAVGQVIILGEVIASPNGQYDLTLQTDGNLVEYGPGHQALWATQSTYGENVIKGIMQTDGNFVLYGPNNANGSTNPLWASNTQGNAGAVLNVQNDGNVVIAGKNNSVLWSTGTTGGMPASELTILPGQSVSSPKR